MKRKLREDRRKPLWCEHSRNRVFGTFTVPDGKKLQLSSCRGFKNGFWLFNPLHLLTRTDFCENVLFFSHSAPLEIHKLTRWDKDQHQGEKEFFRVSTSDKKSHVGAVPLEKKHNYHQWRLSQDPFVDPCFTSYITSPPTYAFFYTEVFGLCFFFATRNKAGLVFCKYGKEICIFKKKKNWRQFCINVFRQNKMSWIQNGMSVNVYPKGQQWLLLKPNTYTRTWSALALVWLVQRAHINTLEVTVWTFIQVYHSSLFEKYSKVSFQI